MEWKKGACSHMAYLKNKGQIAILLALLMPIFLLMLGIALDLGWYYLNVSRLQNAADAAVIAGAQEIIKDRAHFSDYKVISLVSKYPAKVSNEYRTSNAAELETIVAGEKMALTPLYGTS